MTLGQWLGRGLGRAKGGGKTPSPSPAVYAPGLAQRYQTFTDLLKANNRALDLMAELQGRIQGEADISTLFVQQSVDELANQVGLMVARLEEMSPAAAQGLPEIYADLVGGIRHALSNRRAIPESPLTLPLERVHRDMEEVAGGKAANLGELAGRLGLPTPPGFVVTTHAFKRFLDHNDLWARIHEILARSQLEETEQVFAASAQVERLILAGELPPDLALALDQGYQALMDQGGDPALGVAVRSSAILEDTSAGFAGQYQTALGVGRDALAAEYLRVLASQFSPQVVSYRHRRGLGLEEVAMAVAVMAMVGARVSGVLYTCNPNDPQERAMMVSAVKGLGAKAVGGQMPTSLIILEKSPGGRVLRQEIVEQETMTVIAPGGGVTEAAVDPESRDRPPLTQPQLARLAGLGLELEEHYGRPVDVEWAIDEAGNTFVLQARGLRIISKSIQPADYDRLVAGRRVLLEAGVTAGGGVAAGRVVQAHTPGDLARVVKGSVLVAQSSLPEYAMALENAAALVTEVGGPASHLASVARERRAPAIFAAPGALEALAEGTLVTVDADRCRVYEGEVRALVLLQKRRLLALAETRAYRTLERVLRRIVPLNLTDPRAPEFAPAHCQSLHDITRYSHEMAMREMFRYGEACLDAGGDDACLVQGAARRLAADFPLELYLIDLGGGIDSRACGPTVSEGEITSLPMLALLRGIHSVEWRGPGAVGADALASTLKERGEEDGARLAFRHNYVLLSRHYMNLSSRLGFHYSTLDAWCSDDAGDNYLRLTFMRGGADLARRARRARYIGAILERHGFWVEIKQDNVYARLEKYPASVLSEKLKVIGRLIVGTRQMDMVMFSDAVVDWYIEQFMKDEASPVSAN